MNLAEIFYDSKQKQFLINFTYKGEPVQSRHPDTPFEKQVILMGTVLSWQWYQAGMGDGTELSKLTALESLNIKEWATLTVYELADILKQAGISNAHPILIFEVLKKYPFKLQYQST